MKALNKEKNRKNLVNKNKNDGENVKLTKEGFERANSVEHTFLSRPLFKDFSITDIVILLVAIAVAIISTIATAMIIN